MKGNKESLVFKFVVIFLIFTILTLFTNGVHTYAIQVRSYHQQCERDISQVANYLENLISSDGKTFAQLQDWWVDYVNEIYIPMDFDGNWTPAKEEFERQFSKKYPNETLDITISFQELDLETQKAWATWQYEYWLNVFEEARPAFNVKYTYYVLPRGDDGHFFWMIDALREPFENPTPETEGMIDLRDDYFDDIMDDYPNAKITWLTKEQTHSYDIYDNEYGKTYAYTVPFVFEGKIYGLIGVDIEVADVNKEILRHTFFQLLGMAGILIIAVLITVRFIYNRYIQKLILLQSSVRKYTNEKNPDIAQEIEASRKGNDEIALLTSQIAHMIRELENYIKSLFETNRELKNTKALAKEMNDLAIKDTLTGIRNKTAYDREVSRLSWQIAEGNIKFGLIMIDLNFLKRINDTYGHEKGDIAIKRLSTIVCHIFEHSPVFRIGGDEFIVILENTDYDNINTLLSIFNHTLEAEQHKPSCEPWERVSAAIGVAFFEKGKDEGVENVFKRADKAMYENKKAMKATRD